VFRSESAAIFMGGACCAVAFAIFRVGGRSDLVAQFGLAVSLAGQALLAFGLHESTNGGTTFYVGLAVVEIVLAFALNNFVNRVCSAFIASLLFGYVLRDLGIPGTAPGVLAFALSILWRTESSWAAQGSMWRAIGYGMAFALIFPDFSALYAGFARDGLPVSPSFWATWVKSVLVGAALIYTVHELLAAERVTTGSVTWNAAIASSVGVALVTLRAPGITSALLLLVVGFARGNRALFGVGVAALLWYLATFYYSLQTSLLWKSFALGMTGATLLLLWAIARQLFGASDDAPARESASA